jgi:hypothetical protein
MQFNEFTKQFKVLTQVKKTALAQQIKDFCTEMMLNDSAYETLLGTHVSQAGKFRQLLARPLYRKLSEILDILELEENPAALQWANAIIDNLDSQYKREQEDLRKQILAIQQQIYSAQTHQQAVQLQQMQSQLLLISRTMPNPIRLMERVNDLAPVIQGTIKQVSDYSPSSESTAISNLSRLKTPKSFVSLHKAIPSISMEEPDTREDLALHLRELDTLYRKYERAHSNSRLVKVTHVLETLDRCQDKLDSMGQDQNSIRLAQETALYLTHISSSPTLPEHIQVKMADAATALNTLNPFASLVTALELVIKDLEERHGKNDHKIRAVKHFISQLSIERKAFGDIAVFQNLQTAIEQAKQDPLLTNAEQDDIYANLCRALFAHRHKWYLGRPQYPQSAQNLMTAMNETAKNFNLNEQPASAIVEEDQASYYSSTTPRSVASNAHLLYGNYSESYTSSMLYV